jgi:thiol-disulfide isomerase/thioredoxin
VKLLVVLLSLITGIVSEASEGSRFLGFNSVKKTITSMATPIQLMEPVYDKFFLSYKDIVTGSAVSKEETENKWIILYYWAPTWCPSCKMTLASGPFKRLLKKPNFYVLGVVVNEVNPEDVRSALIKYKESGLAPFKNVTIEAFGNSPGRFMNPGLVAISPDMGQGRKVIGPHWGMPPVLLFVNKLNEFKE